MTSESTQDVPENETGSQTGSQVMVDAEEPLSIRDRILRDKANGTYPHNLVGEVEFDLLNHHRYNYSDKGDKPDDPGWHGCTCQAWHGYWHGFNQHLAELIVAWHEGKIQQAPTTGQAQEGTR